VTKLHLVTAQNKPHPTMHLAIESACKECQAAQPSVYFMAWESDGELHIRCAPASITTLVGMIYRLAEEYLDGGE
jgi:hypothetical protein